MFLELRAQNIGMMGLTPLQYTRQTENNLFQDNFNKYRYLSFAYTYMGYNLKIRFLPTRECDRQFPTRSTRMKLSAAYC